MDGESELADTVKTENTDNDRLQQKKIEVPERFVDGNGQTVNPLTKHQEVQCSPLGLCDKDTQARSLFDLHKYCFQQVTQWAIHDACQTVTEISEKGQAEPDVVTQMIERTLRTCGWMKTRSACVDADSIEQSGATSGTYVAAREKVRVCPPASV